MENIINKKFKRIGSVGGDIFEPIDIETQNETEWIIFSNGARCKKETFNTEFELIIETINETKNQQNLEIDPDAFFNTPTADESLLNQLDLAVTNPEALAQKTRYDLSEPQPPAHMLKAMESQPQIKGSGILDRLTDDMIDTSMNQYNTQQNFQQNFQQQLRVNRSPEFDVFDRVKKSEKVIITIPFEIKLPKASKIDTMDDMFESSFIEYISEQYINETVMKDVEQLKQIISDSIKEWVDINLNNKKVKLKNSNTFLIDKPEEITEIKETNEED